MSKIYGYCRTSSTDQTLDVQRAQLNDAGCDVILEEQVSGASRVGRPKLALLMEVIGPGDVVMVTKLDRLARDTIDMLELVREIAAKGAGFKSIAENWVDTTSPAGELILTVMAGVAQFERKRIKERQREGIAMAKAKGIYKGGKRKFNADDIRRMHFVDGMGPSEIARRIGARTTMTVYRAIKAKTDGQESASTVQ